MVVSDRRHGRGAISLSLSAPPGRISFIRDIYSQPLKFHLRITAVITATRDCVSQRAKRETDIEFPKYFRGYCKSCGFASIFVPLIRGVTCAITVILPSDDNGAFYQSEFYLPLVLRHFLVALLCIHFVMFRPSRDPVSRFRSQRCDDACRPNNKFRPSGASTPRFPSPKSARMFVIHGDRGRESFNRAATSH